MPTSDSPSSVCDASSKNNNDRLCAARALTMMSGPSIAMRSVVRDGAGFEQPLQWDALPLAFAEQRNDVRHRVNAADQQFATEIDIGAVPQVRVTIDWITARMFFTR